MDKFSIYELMSFFFPGLLGVSIVGLWLPSNWIIFSGFSELAMGVLITIIATIAGLALHRLTFYLIEYNWYKRYAKKSITLIAKQYPEEVGHALKNLKKNYNPQNLSDSDLFDKAYHYLLAADKIVQAVSFQSMYFFLRNMITLAIVVIPISAVLFFSHYKQEINAKILILMVLVSAIALSANFYRMKMVSRVFNTYLTLLEIKKTDDKQTK